MAMVEVAPPPRSGVPPGLLDEATTIPGALAALARTAPGFPCLTILDRARRERRLTVGELWEEGLRVAAALRDAGARPGTFVLLVLPTGPELVTGYFGALLAGAVPGLLAMPGNRVADPALYAARIGSILANAEARVLYCHPEVAAVFAEVGPGVLRGARVLVPGESPSSGGVTPFTPAPADVATVQYSSGSTGTPKGVLLTHRAVLNNLRAIRDGLGLEAGDVSVNWLPLYHDMGLVGAFLLPVLCGLPAVLIPTMDFLREPALWLWAIHRYRGTLSWAPNFGYSLAARRLPDRDLDGLDLSSWRIAVSAAEPVLATTIRAFTERFADHGFRPEATTPAWGLAETVLLATAHPVAERPRIETIDRAALAREEIARPVAGRGVDSVAVGRCLPRSEISIRDSAGRELPERHVGAIFLRSDSLFAGYHRDPAATAAVLRHGWLVTGDRGYLAGGDLFFVARDKDLIVIGGEKYAPQEVEAAIDRVPGVRQGCAVAFGMLDEERGTEVIAAVVETREEDPVARERLDAAIRTAVVEATGLALRYLLLVAPGGIEKTTSGKLARGATCRRWADALRRGDGGGEG